MLDWPALAGRATFPVRLAHCALPQVQVQVSRRRNLLAGAPHRGKASASSASPSAARESVAERAAAAKLKKAQLAQRAALFHQSRTKHAQQQGKTSETSNGSTANAGAASIDAVAQVLSHLTAEPQGYEAFVASLSTAGLGLDIERVDSEGHNALTQKAQRMAEKEHRQKQGTQAVPPMLAALRQQDAGERKASEPYDDGEDEAAPAAASDVISPLPRAAAAAAAPSAAPASAPPSAMGSDLLLLMRMLAEDKARFAGNGRIVTGLEEEDEANNDGGAGGDLLQPLRELTCVAFCRCL